MPVTLLVWEMGTQGLAKVDCVTVWLLGANWNCTMSPAGTLMSLGANVREPLALPTLTTWTVVPAVWAKAPATLMAAKATVVNCILKFCCFLR